MSVPLHQPIEEGQSHQPTENAQHLSVINDHVQDPPPDGGYAWVIVGVVFTINAFTWGQTAVCGTEPA